MTWWPGWDSIECAGWWSGFYFWFGIFCLFMLGVSEMVSHRYGQRRDALVAIAEDARSRQRTQEEIATQQRHASEIGGLKEQLSEAEDKVLKLQKQQADRRFSPEQKQMLIATLSPFKGQLVDITSVLGDSEAHKLAEEIASVFAGAEWNYGGGASQAVYSGTSPVGVQVVVNSERVDAGNPPKAARALVEALQNAKIAVTPLKDAGVPADGIRLIVGRKPPPP